jgi:DNA adenine methylase
LNTIWTNLHVLTKDHFYHLGGSEKNRNPMLEALISNFEAQLPEKKNKEIMQGNLFDFIEDSPTPSMATAKE